MIIECSHCHARYQYDPARFEGKASKKIRCAKCHQIFEIANPELMATETAPAAAATAAPARAKADHDLTMTRRKSYSGTAIDSPALADLQDEEEAKPHVPRPALPPDKRFSLAITDGADSAKVFRIEKPRVTIGRTGADVALNDAEVSREHAALEIHSSIVYLEDLGSTNGTFLNGHKIEGSQEIQNQQEFTVGMTTLMLIITAAD